MQWSSNPDRVDELAPHWRFSHIADEVIPALKAAGISEEAIRRVTVDNPRVILSGRSPY
jgi:phosphotriesterase-related protein